MKNANPYGRTVLSPSIVTYGRRDIFECAECGKKFYVWFEADQFPYPSSILVNCPECDVLQKASQPDVPEAKWVNTEILRPSPRE